MMVSTVTVVYGERKRKLGSNQHTNRRNMEVSQPSWSELGSQRIIFSAISCMELEKWEETKKDLSILEHIRIIVFISLKTQQQRFIKGKKTIKFIEVREKR